MRKIKLQGFKKAAKPKRETGQTAHPRYGMITITYARFGEKALIIGWSCRLGFGQLIIRQNYTTHLDRTKNVTDPGWATFTPAPGIHMDTEAMGPEFVSEVMKAFYWQQEAGIPETYDYNEDGDGVS